MFETYGHDGVIQIDYRRKVLASGPPSSHSGGGVTGPGNIIIVNKTGLRGNLEKAFSFNPTKSYWIRLSGNGCITCLTDLNDQTVPSGEDYSLYATRGLTVTIREATNNALNHSSGYLDVFDASGNLQWSASGARDCCNVIGQSSFTINQAVNGNASYLISGNPWIFLNSFQSVSWWNQNIQSNTENGVLLEKSGDRYSLFAGWGIGQNENDYVPKYGQYSVPMIFGQFI